MKDSLKRYLEPDVLDRVLKAAKSGLPVIIDGVQGSTGKTTTKDILESEGYTVFEMFQLNNPMTEEEKKFSKLWKSGNTVAVVINLNRLFERRK